MLLVVVGCIYHSFDKIGFCLGNLTLLKESIDFAGTRKDGAVKLAPTTDAEVAVREKARRAQQTLVEESLRIEAKRSSHGGYREINKKTLGVLPHVLDSIPNNSKCIIRSGQS